MKKIIKFFLLGSVAFSAFSCDSFLDINEDPNRATTATAQQILPSALTATAAAVVNLNEYGGWQVGYIANAGGFGGWGTTLTYNYTTTDYNAPWNALYDNLSDYKYIETRTNRVEEERYYNAIAKIMLAFGFQALVDTYNDVPYSEALQGLNSLSPKYDRAEDIYRDLIDNKLDSAIWMINNPGRANTIGTGTGDVLFNGNMNLWLRLANTLKLRMLVRIAEVPSMAAFAQAEFATLATSSFLNEDAIVQPGYIVSTGKQNPFWNTYHSTPTGARAQAGRSRITTNYALSFYDGGQITDVDRGFYTYQGFSANSVATNDLGVQSQETPSSPAGTVWYVSSAAITAGGGIGLLKSATMGQPIFLLAESNLLLSEARLRGYLAGDAQTVYTAGITASFRYLSKNANNTVFAGVVPTTEAADYITANAGNPLVDWTAATTTDQRLRAIITQKYIALNMIHGHEAWNEYRRTGYPEVNNQFTFASTTSSATMNADRLPKRILYPASEYQVNSANAPSGVSPYTSRIFWDIN